MENGRQWYGRILVGIANLAALAVAILLPIHYASPQGQLLIPLAAVLPTTIICAIIPILTSVFSIRWLRRRARARRAVESDTPALLPTTSD